ncbi:hypothetical protein H6P81_020309 [Aristolochia fimbriata]|uniref:F-box domain-containing protein n=1 Tax=Aristolochia fimbriata TaxID=158543 RepID=A0AAV7DV75_ARIFI|nr:hypothetical protein H6P81_020309 [Aristolochia fimbriata]
MKGACPVDKLLAKALVIGNFEGKMNEMEVDKISNLPVDIVRRIFKYLPMREVVQTSLLSTNWRYKWLAAEELIFDRRCFRSSQRDSDVKLASFVNQVLLLHEGPISKFKIDNYLEKASSDVDRWLLVLSRKQLIHLVLTFRSGDYYKLPSSLFSLKHIKYLKLSLCLFSTPLSFGGFSCLTALDLQQVHITNETFQSIICKSPLLQRLQLISCYGLRHLSVTAPKLEWLFFHGDFDDLHFDVVSHLVEVTISLCNLADGGARGAVSRLEWYLRHLTNLKKLVFYNYFLKFLSTGIVPDKLSVSYCNLKYLRLHVNMEDSNQILAAFCLFRSSPNLEHIRIEAKPNKPLLLLDREGLWDASSTSNIGLTHVKVVEITGCVGLERELDFVRFFLIITPVLERMTIEMHKKAATNDSEQLKWVKNMLRFRRASSRAEGNDSRATDWSSYSRSGCIYNFVK